CCLVVFRNAFGFEKSLGSHGECSEPWSFHDRTEAHASLGRHRVPRCERQPGAIGAFKVVNQNGEPFFYLGDTAWTLLKRLNREEVDEYVKNHAAKGFTGIQAYVLRGLEVKNIKPLLLAAVDEESGKDACAPSD